MKYIVLELQVTDGVKREVPIVFPNCLTHAIVAESIVSSPELKGAVAISAGFIDMDANTCYSESESLKLKSRGVTDRLLIDCHDHLNGLVH